MSYDKIGMKRLIVLFLSVPLIALGLFSCNQAEETTTQPQLSSGNALAPAAHVDKTWPATAQAGDPHIAYYNTLKADSSWISKLGLEKVEKIQSVGVNADASKVYVPAQSGIFVVDTRTGEMSMFVDLDENVNTTHGITVAENGDVYVVYTPYKAPEVDANGNRTGGVTDMPGEVVVFNSAGEELKRFGSFSNPAGIALDNQRQLAYVADTTINQVSAWNTATGELVRYLSVDSPKNVDSRVMSLPVAVAVNSEGYVYVVNWGKHKIMIFSPEDGTYVNSFGNQGIWPSQFTNPKGIAIDSDNNVYITDVAFDNMQVFAKTSDSYAHALAIHVGKGGTGIGEFNLPSQIAIDNQDRIYVAELGAHRIQIFQYVKGE